MKNPDHGVQRFYVGYITEGAAQLFPPTLPMDNPDNYVAMATSNRKLVWTAAGGHFGTFVFLHNAIPAFEQYIADHESVPTDPCDASVESYVKWRCQELLAICKRGIAAGGMVLCYEDYDGPTSGYKKTEAVELKEVPPCA